MFISRNSRFTSLGVPKPHFHLDAFSCSIFVDQGLSGSVQWQCIRNGSGNVQLFSRVLRPNHRGYTTLHYVGFGFMFTNGSIFRFLVFPLGAMW